MLSAACHWLSLRRGRPRRPRGSPARKFASAAPGPGPEERGEAPAHRGRPARLPPAAQGRATCPPAAAAKDRPPRSVCAPLPSPSSVPASPAGPPSEPPAAWTAVPSRARALPGTLGLRWGARSRPRSPPRPAVLTRCLHFSFVLVPARTRRARPRRRHSRADPAGRPAGPAGAEEARPHRPPGGSAARHLLKAPHLPRLVIWCLFVSRLRLLSLGAKDAGLGLGRPLPSVFTF